MTLTNFYYTRFLNVLRPVYGYDVTSSSCFMSIFTNSIITIIFLSMYSFTQIKFTVSRSPWQSSPMS